MLAIKIPENDFFLMLEYGHYLTLDIKIQGIEFLTLHWIVYRFIRSLVPRPIPAVCNTEKPGMVLRAEAIYTLYLIVIQYGSHAI